MLRFLAPWSVCSVLILFAPAIATPADRLVSVSGSGLVSVPPDEVVVKIQFSTVDDDLVRVRADSDKQLKTILDLAQKQGAKPGDYDVSSLKLELSYNEQLKRQVYEVQRELSVKLGVLANLNPLLADLLKLSDIRIESITFGSSKAGRSGSLCLLQQASRSLLGCSLGMQLPQGASTLHTAACISAWHSRGCGRLTRFSRRRGMWLASWCRSAAWASSCSSRRAKSRLSAAASRLCGGQGVREAQVLEDRALGRRPPSAHLRT